MIENIKVTITTAQRSVDFMLTFDSDFPPDRNMRLVLGRDGACEPEIVHLMTRVIAEGDTVIDGGANVGFFTCLMSRLVGPTGHVIAVEPTPVNIKKIKHNLANNKIKNVEVVEKALYDEVRALPFYMGHDTGSNSLSPFAEMSGTMKVKTVTIDEVLNGASLKLIKLDVEGAEFRVLQSGIYSLVARPKPYVVCEMNEKALSRARASRRDVRNFMQGHGYDCFILHADGTLPRFVPFDTEIVSNKENLMVLFATFEMVAQAWPTVEIAV